MARRRRTTGQALMDAAMRYYLDEPVHRDPAWETPEEGSLRWWEQQPPEHHEAWDDYEQAKKQPTFAAIHRAWVEDEQEDRVAFFALRDLLCELGLDRHLDRVMGFIEAARNNYQLPF